MSLRSSYLVVLLAVQGLFIGAFARLALPGQGPALAAADDGRRARRARSSPGSSSTLITGENAAPGFLGALVFSVVIIYFIRRRRGGGLTSPGAGRAAAAALSVRAGPIVRQ